MDNSFESLKVMVIDDSKTIRRTAETLLKKVGCEVITATDGFDALAKIADTKPDIIFVDIMMPRLDGYQTCALIKNNSAFKETPVIMLSSKDGLFDKAKGRIVGSDQYLTKPVGMKQKLLSVNHQSELGWAPKQRLKKAFWPPINSIWITRTKEFNSMTDPVFTLATSSWDDKEIDAINRVVASGFFSMGKEVATFAQSSI